MRFFWVALIFCVTVLTMLFSISLAGTAVQQNHGAAAVAKAALVLLLTPDLRAPISKDGMTFLAHPGDLKRIIRQFERQGWVLKEESGYAFRLENNESRMTITTQDLTRIFRVCEITITPLPKRPSLFFSK